MLVEWPGGSWEAALGMVGVLTLAYVILIWMALVFWTVRDASRRTTDVSAQVVSGALVLLFFVPGYWLYLILRPRLTLAEKFERNLEAEAVLAELSDRLSCGGCGRRVQEDYLHCPSCKATLRRPCDSCGRSMDFAWVICPGCGTEAAHQPARIAPAPVPAGKLGAAQLGAAPARPRPAPFPRPGVDVNARSRPNKSTANAAHSTGPVTG